MRKRILSILLVVVMCFTMMPTTTFAAESAEHEQATEIPEAVCTCGTDDQAIHATNCPAYVAPENPECSCAEKCTEDNVNVWCEVCSVQGAKACIAEDEAAAYADGDVASVTVNGTTTSYTDIQSAVDAAENQSGSTLMLLDNVALTNGTSIAIGGGTFTFDLAGHTITFAEQANNVAIKVSAGDIIFTDSGDSGSVVVPGTYTNSRAMVISGGMVTIDGGSYTARNAIDISEGAALTVYDGTITAASTSGIGISSSGTLNIHGGSIHTNSDNGYGCAIYLSGSCTATITGGAFTYTGTSGTNHLFRYSGGNLDLTNYSNLDGLTFSSGSSSTTDVTNVKLPDGYVFLDKAGNQTMTVTATSLADRILTIRSLVSLSNVTISFAAAEGGGTMESESISSGEPYTLPENGFTAPEGMKFKAWKVGDDTTEYQPGAEISVTTDTVITAVWEDITYKITYAAGEGSGTMDSGTAMYGVAFTLPNCTFTAPSAGYEFKAWLIGGAEYTAGETYTFTEDTTVTAVWQIATSGQALVIDKDGVILGRYSSVTAAVTVAEANNGSTLKLMEAVTLDSPIYIESGTFTVDINGQSVTVSNSVFNVSGTAAITFTDTADSKGLVTSNSTGLSAAIRVYGGTAVIQNGVYAGPSSVLVTSGGTATINGGTFNNKLYNDGGTLTVNDTTAQDVTIENSTVAVDTIVSGGAITEVSFNGGTLSFKNHPNPAGIEVYYNASVTEIPLPAGYYFTDGNGTVTTAFTTGKTYTIRASEGLSTVSFDANGGTGTMASIVMEQGNYTLPACGFTAPEHYIFRTWQIGDDEYAPGKNITVSADVSVKAVWQPVKYTVTFNANGGGSTMDTVSVDYGAAYTLPECTFTAPDGKEFREWLSGNVRYASGDQITITGDTLVAAVWDTASFDIIFDANGGSGTMTTDEVNYGTAYYVLPSCAFTAPNGMEFDCWKIGDTTCAPGDVVEITENITITAQWKTHTHNWNEGADGSVTCSVCSEQAVAQLTALSFSDPNDVVSYYTNLQAALDAGAALTGYGNIKLLDNVTGNFTADGPIGNIDLNGKTITAGSADAPALKITDKVDAVYPCIFGGTIQSSGGTALEITGETSGSSQFFFGSRGDPFANIEDNPLHLSGKTAIKASSIALNLEIGSISATENAVVLSDGATVSFSGQTSVDLDGAKVDFAIEGDYTDAPLSFDTINMPGTVYTITMENPGVFAKPGTFASLYEFQLETNMFTSAMEGYVVAKDGDNLKLTKGITEGMVRNTPSGEYNGSAHTVTADQFTVVWTDTSGTETTLTAGTDYDIRLPAEEMVNAGDYTITIVGKGDYIGEATGTFTIGKAAAQTLTGEIAVTNGHAYEYTFDLSGYKPTGEDVSWGDSVTYTLDTVSITESGYYTNNSAKVEGNTLTLPINEVESTATDSIGTVTVKITSQNFEESTLTLTINRINMSNEDIISVDISWGALSFTYTDGAWNPDTHSYGEGGWTADGNIVTVSNSGTATVSATLSYENTAGYSFTGTFDTASSTLAAGENKTFTLTLSGKPAESMTAAVIGTVTVKIEEGGE